MRLEKSTYSTTTVAEIPRKHGPKHDNLDKIDNLDIVFLCSWIVIGGPLIATKKERTRQTETPQQPDVSTISALLDFL
jgi:ATP-dependent protease Clp ATPase subunit